MSRKLFEIDNDIESCLDPETGEFNEERFETLSQERDDKIENLICLYKNIMADAKALKDQEDIFKSRRKTEENNAKRLAEYIKYALNGVDFATAKASAKFKGSKAVECDDSFVSWALTNDRDDLLRYKDPEPDKEAIKNALNSGEKIPARIVENCNINIK